VSDAGYDEEAVREALDALRSGESVSLAHVLLLAEASLNGPTSLVGRPVIEAVGAVSLCERDLANGGLDQFVWNQGANIARRVAAAFRAVGALENADVIDALAVELDGYLGENDAAAVAQDPVRHFLAYRRRGGGPFFAIPELHHEVGEALVEYAIAHADEEPQ
jgi:hypothetical protein